MTTNFSQSSFLFIIFLISFRRCSWKLSSLNSIEKMLSTCLYQSSQLQVIVDRLSYLLLSFSNEVYRFYTRKLYKLLYILNYLDASAIWIYWGTLSLLTFGFYYEFRIYLRAISQLSFSAINPSSFLIFCRSLRCSSFRVSKLFYISCLFSFSFLNQPSTLFYSVRFTGFFCFSLTSQQLKKSPKDRFREPIPS